MISLKSRYAYKMTCENFTQYAKDTGSGLYFWTFTLRKAQEDSFVGGMFSAFIRRVCHWYRLDMVPLGGVRVIERHKSGVPHWHSVVNKRIPVDELRKLGKRFGIGRMEVKKVYYSRGAFDYLREYMEKEKTFQGRGVRLSKWSTFGFTPFATKVNDVVCENSATRALSRVRSEAFNGERVPNWLCRDLIGSMHLDYRERLDFIIWRAKELRAQGKDEGLCWDTFGWEPWLIQQEMEGIGERHLDGRLPF